MHRQCITLLPGGKPTTNMLNCWDHPSAGQFHTPGLLHVYIVYVHLFEGFYGKMHAGSHNIWDWWIDLPCHYIDLRLGGGCGGGVRISWTHKVTGGRSRACSVISTHTLENMRRTQPILKTELKKYYKWYNCWSYADDLNVKIHLTIVKSLMESI